MVFAASRVTNAFGLLLLLSGSLTLFFNSLPLVQSQVRPKSISRRSLLFLTGIGRRWRTSGAKSRCRPLKVWPAFSIMLPPLIRSLLLLPSYFSLIGADCIARFGAPYPSFTVGGAFRFISFSLPALWL